ncbi:paraquat-inducible protein A [Catenovulum sp. SM1970]|uniref:paraquat-inducible protein A n=1 Tax=Marinifaba aquimaris TaxID=2741323 RepID=UPI001573B6F4|nr:paraquat-inducible protein A [Marinifaba aquimaris]NTS75569.1 paraquat-inducible protein A [Marinifaba aquimaris]
MDCDKVGKDYVACFECDLLIETPKLTAKQSAFCPRCHSLITAKSSNNLQYALAYAFAAVILLVVANLFPFLGFSAQGNKLTMTLWQSAQTLYHYQSEILALLVFSFIILIPSLLVLGVIYVLWPLIFSRQIVKGGIPIARALFTLKHWSMAEVFLIGVIASLTKITSMAQVELGLSFWAYILFVIALTLSLSSLDKYRFWHYLDQAKRCQHLHQ